MPPDIRRARVNFRSRSWLNRSMKWKGKKRESKAEPEKFLRWGRLGGILMDNNQYILIL